MSWHLPHRFTTMHRAVSIALLYSVSSAALPSVAQAATMGKTTITSAQHEPLAASIMVTDINAADFSASLANASVYQQMGLTPTASMTVRFVPTSATSGKVIINTTQPVSMPFADVVLALNDDGKRNVVPKTLLMPLGKSVPVKEPSRTLATAQKPDLPLISAADTQPLNVKREAPPPLKSGEKTSIQARTLPSVSTPKITAAETPPIPLSQESSISNMLANTLQTSETRSVTSSSAKDSPTKVMDERTEADSATDAAVTNKPKPPATISNKMPTTNARTEKNTRVQANVPSVATTDKQLDILNVEVTRKIETANKKVTTDEANQPLLAAKETASIADSTDKVVPKEDTKTAAVKAKAAAEQAAASKTGDDSAKATSYTVQSNDNLWIISQQIAEKNNIDIQTVMAQIQDQNPDAFVEQDASRLRNNVQLDLPSYDVVPSQQSLQTAIVAQRQQYQEPEKTETRAEQKQAAKDKAASKAKSEATKASKRADKPAVTKTQTLPQARFSVLAPGRDGSADGTQTKAAAETGDGLSTDILATLKASRQRNATQAKRLNATNSSLGSYTKKLQLQNRKLAELEARLKKLRNQ